MCQGIADELLGIDLGDERLNKRSRKVIEALAADPQASVNGACQGWAETIGAYRLFDNPSVTPELVLQPHRRATQRRMREHPVVLVVQDTTELDYTNHPPRDARCLNYEARFGLYGHDNLAVTPGKLCLGVLSSEYHDRAAETLGKANARRTLPIEQKESMRWLKGYRLACQMADECPQTQIVSVADREADIYDIFVDAQARVTGEALTVDATESSTSAVASRRADYIIRAQENRSTPERDLVKGPKVFCKVRDEVAQSRLLGTKTIELSQTPQRAARQAKLEIRAITVTVKPPHARAYLPAITHNVVFVVEVDGPGDETDVSWLLMTTLPISTLEEVWLVVDYYVARWVVEIFFRVLKSGCRVEDCQLETLPRLKNYLAFYKIIAWRILYLTYLNRVTPTLPCTAVFTEDEWKPVYRVVTKQELPPQPPTLNEFMRLLTELGGYNNRKTEAPAGPQPLWIGLRRMLDFATAWQTFGPKT